MADLQVPLVTVVIPCYGQAHFLADAIDSALAQTHPRVEVVVVNDGSPDDTSAVARGYGERVRVIEQENTGLSGARNAGIQASEGEFIALLDADDALHPECVERRVAMLQGRPDVGLVTGAVRFVDETMRPLERFQQSARPAREAGFRDLLRGNLGPTCGTVVRRRALELCGLYDPLLRSCEDWDALIRIATKYRLLYDPEPLADLREVSGSMSRNHATMWDTAVAVMRKNRAYAEGAWSYFLASRIGLFHHLLLMMNRVRFEETSRVRVFAKMARLAVARPATLPFFAAWGARYASNLVARPFRSRR